MPPYGSRLFRFDIQNFRNVAASGVHAPPTGNPGSATAKFLKRNSLKSRRPPLRGRRAPANPLLVHLSILVGGQLSGSTFKLRIQRDLTVFHG